MCELFSFSITRDGNILAVLGDERKKAIVKGENPDSHSYIAEVFGVREDDCWKYEMKAVNPLPSSIDEVMERLEYDGGLPEEEIPLSYIQKLKKWWQENEQQIKSAIDYTLHPYHSLIYDILEGEQVGNFFVDTYGEVADIWENIKYHAQQYGDKNNVSVRWDDKRCNITILTSPSILIYYRPNGLEGDVNALLVVSYKRAFIENGEIAYQKRIAIYPFSTEQG